MEQQRFWRMVALAIICLCVGNIAHADRNDSVPDILVKGPSGDLLLVGTITAINGASTTNQSTAVPFPIIKGAHYIVQCDAAACPMSILDPNGQALFGGTVTCSMAQTNTAHRQAAFDDWAYDPRLSCPSTQGCVAIAGVAAATVNCTFLRAW